MRFIVSCVVTLMLTSTAAFASESTDALPVDEAVKPMVSHSVAANGMFEPELGGGWSSLGRMATMGSPIKNVKNLPITYSGVQNTIKTTSTVDRETLSEYFNIYSSASGGWGRFSGGGEAEYMHYTKNTQYVRNFTYLERYYAKARLDTDELRNGIASFTDAAKEICHNDDRCSDPNTYDAAYAGFTKRYGDGFIAELPMGAILAINLQIKFNSASDVRKFSASIHGQMGNIFNADTTIASVVEKTGIHADVELTAHQLGGDPKNLAKLFKKDKKGKYYLTNCSLQDLSSCKDTIDGIYDYAKDDFAKQIQVINNKPRAGVNFAVVGRPTVVKYSDMPELAEPIDPPEDIYAMRTQLINLYEGYRQRLDFIQHILQVPMMKQFMLPSAKKSLKQAENDLAYNMSLFETYNIMNCYLPGPGRTSYGCLTVAQNIEARVRKINKGLIKQFQFPYSTYNQSVPGKPLNYMVPIGEYNYIQYVADSTDPIKAKRADMTIKPKPGSVKIRVEGKDVKTNVRFSGTLQPEPKSPSIYKGPLYYSTPTGNTWEFTFKKTDNPL